MTATQTNWTPKIGERVRLRFDFDRFPFFALDKGEAGTIDEVDRDNGVLGVKMDRDLGEDCAEWDNCLILSDDDGYHVTCDTSTLPGPTAKADDEPLVLVAARYYLAPLTEEAESEKPTYTIVLKTDAASDELHETLAMLDPNAEVYPGRLVGEES